MHLPGEVFEALPQIIGTLETSAIALIIAIPVSIGAALVIVERLPKPAGERDRDVPRIAGRHPQRGHRAVGGA